MKNEQNDFIITKATTEQDFQDGAFVTNTLSKSFVINLEGLKHDIESDSENFFAIARLNNEPAGTVVCKPSSAPEQAFMMVRVLPEYRKQGLGELLYKVASEHAKTIGRFSLQGRVKEDDPGALDFFLHRGFEEVARECMVSLYTTGLNLEPIKVPEGIEVISLEGRQDLWEGAYKVALEGIPDIPAPEPLTVGSLDKWLQTEIKAPGVRLDGSFVAISDGRVIGYGGMEQINEKSCEHLLTAVVRDWRGKGISKLLKQAQIQWAIQNGIEELVTYNDALNDPIRRLNAGLGYKPHPINFIIRGKLHPSVRAE